MDLPEVKRIDKVIAVSVHEGLSKVVVEYTDVAGEKYELRMTCLDALILARKLAALNIS